VRPSNPVIQLKPDEKRTVPFVVSLPPVPTPLDVFFMTDSTGSMDTTIGSVQESVQQIVDNLSASGVDLHFGVADFRDWPEQPGDSETYPYKLRRKAGPIGEELEGALESIQTGGGTTDGDDAALEAIYQATTGAGRRDPLPGSPRGQMLPAGLDAGFRDDALKVILSVSDDEMRAGFPNPTRPDYPGPTMQTVIAALKAADVHLVGIRVGDSKPLRADYERLAAGSGTVAPPAGTDCDGDGDADLSAGAPLVCDFNPGTDSIASAFISLLGGIRDFQNVRVRVGDPSGVARSLSDTDYGSLDVKASHTFKVPVEFTCGRAQYGTESQVTIDAVVRGATVVGTTATVRCGAPPPPPIVRRPPPPREPPLPDPPVPPPAHLVAAVAFAPAPPAQPVTNINPNANPNPNPNPNAGAATEQEQQGQLALAENDVPPGEEELAFSARPAPVPPTPVTAWLAAAAVTAAAAYGFHLSRRTSPALAYRPREHR
ncbi:MAG TPA: vWA domain-containing protein, partial [Mycobacteriales bacterium]|nr:vWA domain-containing protein [Mycobacteriales bacterium]